MRRVTVALLLFVVWFLLVWPVDPVTGEVGAQDFVMGAAMALLVVAVMRESGEPHPVVPLSPVRLVWLLLYIGVVAYYVVKANLDVTYRVLHPAMPIRPGIVKVRTSLKTPTAITMLANSITLTPGTLTVSAADDGILYVHWINVRSTDSAEATKHVVSRFEWFLKRIFE
jgi:multicomponent Na+:H+ antiporter subunit E